MKILTRYILREHIGPMVAALGVLVGLMLLNQLAKRFGDLVGKGLPWHLIAQVFGLSIPFILAMTMPMAVLVAVLYTFNRLSSDNEITAIRAGGVSLIRLMRPVMIAATLVAVSMIWFNDTVLPESNHALRRLLTDISRKRPTFELRERVVNEVAPGKLFLQAARIDRGRSVLRDLVIFDLGRQDLERTIYADSGLMAFNATQTDLYLTLFDGSMHETDRATPHMDQHTYYAEQVIRISGVSNELELGRGTAFRGDREMNVSMMREEVQSRRGELEEIQDSVTSLLESLVPGAQTPKGPFDRAGRNIELPLGDEGALEAREPAGADETPDLRIPAPGEVQSATNLEGSRQAIRTRAFRPSFASRRGWPPTVAPTTFASRARSEFQRYAGRRDIHQREINRFKVEIHKKFSIPIAAVVFVLIGAPIGVRFKRGGAGLVIGVSLAVFCVYYVFLIGGEDLADRSIISPFWAMWAPNVIFAILGAIILYYVGWGSLRTRQRASPGARPSQSHGEIIRRPALTESGSG